MMLDYERFIGEKWSEKTNNNGILQKRAWQSFRPAGVSDLGVGSALIAALISRISNDGADYFCLDSGYKSAQRKWMKKFGLPHTVVKDLWGPGTDHLIWLCKTADLINEIKFHMEASLIMDQDELFMKEAIRLAEMSVEHGNEPFGAVLVKDGKVVFTNENQIYTKSDPTFHAEAGLLREFFKETHITDLRDYTLYSSCEPCFMCCGAMVWAQLGRLVYAASDIDLCNIINAEGSTCCQLVFDRSHHKPQVTSGVLRDESLRVLTEYFQNHEKG